MAVKKKEGALKAGSGQEKPRKANGQFAKGVSGNPGGGRAMPKDVKDMLSAATPAAAKLLADTINDAKQPRKLRIRCAEIVLDRVYGKPAQSVDLNARDIPQVVFVGADNIAD